MTKLVAFTMLTVLASSSVMLASPDKLNAKSANGGGPQEWMSFYYRTPQPERFVTEVREMSKAGALSQENAEGPMTAFLSRVMAQNPEKIAAWMSDLSDLPERDKAALYKSIWLSDTKQGRQYLKDNGQVDFAKKTPPNLLKLELDSTSVLDTWWGYFFATGDVAPIRQVVSAFNYSKYDGALSRYEKSKKTDEDMKEANYDAIYRAGIWSLASNCREHPKVREICEDLLKSKDLNAVEKEVLGQILSNLDEEKPSKKQSSDTWMQDSKPAAENPWMKSDRGFGAMLVFTNKPQEFLDNWGKPGEGVNIAMSENAPRGKPCGAFILFVGAGTNKDGQADVVADLSITAPDGTVYGREKGVEIWQKKPAPQGKNLELGVGHLGFEIEPKDPAGKYEIRAKIHDRVKGAVVELNQTFVVDK